MRVCLCRLEFNVSFPLFAYILLLYLSSLYHIVVFSILVVLGSLPEADLLEELLLPTKATPGGEYVIALLLLESTNLRYKDSSHEGHINMVDSGDGRRW